MEHEVILIPKITDDLLTNPGIGFIASPQLMGDIDVVYDNRGKVVHKYKFTEDSKTWNHPDSKVFYCGVQWKELEPVKGEFRWDVLERKLEYAKSLGCTAIVRCMPYALNSEEDISMWYRNEYPEEPDFPFWRIDPMKTPYVPYWSEFIKEFANHFDGHPVISSIDMAIVGAWGEGGGTELLEENAINLIVDAYIDNFKLTPLVALLHDPKSLKIITDRKEAIGFRVDCLGDMGGFHGSEWSHMLDFYPQNIQNFHMGNAWKKAPVVFEACWHMNYPLVIRLRREYEVYIFECKADIREWLPDMDILIEEAFTIPSDMPRGDYIIEIGIETGIKEIGNIKLAIEGEVNGYYPMGKITIE